MGFRFTGRVLSASAVMIFLFWTPLELAAQSGLSQHADPSQAGQQAEPIPRDLAAKMEKERLKSRYSDLKRDSEKLLELATELKQYVDKSGENTLSLDVVRKCDQIEKLSKSIRSKMKGD